MSEINLSKASAANFELVFPKLPTGVSVAENKGLTLNIHTTVIPSLTLESAEVNFLGMNRYVDNGGLKFEQWYVNFTVDSRFENWVMLYKWITFINNNKDRFGTNPRGYKVDATLRIIDNFRNEILRLYLYGMWINSLGELKLTYREGNQDLSSNANFVYDRYELK